MENQDRYKTILVIVTGFLVISLIFKIPTLTMISMSIGVVSILLPFAAKWIEWTWNKIAYALGWINSRILLSVVYFLFLLPIAWVSRFFTNDPLKLKRKNTATMYLTRDHLYKKEDLENIW